MKPPTFESGLDLLKAKAWVLGIKKLFEAFSCIDVQKVLFAAFHLRGRSAKMVDCVRDQKVSKFERLRQGNRTMTKYEVQFIELARYAPCMVDIEYKKARKFEGGL
ncbi:hypothetical protein ACSBR1_018044 [Camellia fascicularis]